MSNSILLSKLEENLVFFHKIYDVVRLVDPIKKKVIEYRGSERTELKEVCYNYWGTGEICDNCISTRAGNDNKCYFKLEQWGDTIMMVTAMPIENVDKPTVLELLKDASDSMMIGTGEYSQGQPFQKAVEEINDLIMKDEQTGLYNKKYVAERLPADILRSTLEETPLSVLVMDIDDLRRINNTYGHVNADKLINEVSNIILRHIGNDLSWSARFGGDEFIIVLNKTNGEEAYKLAEDIRKDIAKLSITMQEELVHSTVSIGIHTMQGEVQNAEEIIEMADYKMYEAKRSGKNKSMGMIIN